MKRKLDRAEVLEITRYWDFTRRRLKVLIERKLTGQITPGDWENKELIHSQKLAAVKRRLVMDCATYAGNLDF